MKKLIKLSFLMIAGVMGLTGLAQATVIFDMGTLTTTGEDTTGWDGPGIANFYSGATGRGSLDEPFWSLFTTAAIHGTSSGGDTLAAGDYTVTFNAGWSFSPGSDGPDIASFQAFAWDGSTETALTVSASYNLSGTYNDWDSFEYTFSVADGAAVIGQDLRLKFNQTSGGQLGIDTFQVSSIPEPASTWMVGFSAFALMVLRRRLA